MSEPDPGRISRLTDVVVEVGTPGPMEISAELAAINAALTSFAKLLIRYPGKLEQLVIVGDVTAAQHEMLNTVRRHLDV